MLTTILTIFVVVAVTKVTASCGTGRPQVCNDPVSCADCLAGQFEETTSGGEQICSTCSPGSYTDASNLLACKQCPGGYAQSSPGQTSCIPCSPGEFNAIVGAARCSLCLQGTFFGGKGRNSSCIDCPIGWSSQDGSARCTACGAGTFGVGCRNCPLGFARQRDDDDATQCQQCELGTTTLIEGAARCDVCGAGTFGKTNGVCAACPTGFYQDSKGEIECRDSCAVSEAVPNKQGTACEYPRTTCGQGTVRVEMAQPSEYQFECNPNVLMSTGATLKSSTLVAVVVATSMMSFFAF